MCQFAHIAKSERKKLDVVARRCVLVGYGTEVKGYRLFDPDRCKVFYSRDVKFNELEFGLKECCNVEPIVGYVDIVDTAIFERNLVLKIPCLIELALRLNLEGLRESDIDLNTMQKELMYLLSLVNLTNASHMKMLLQVSARPNGKKPWRLKCSPS